MENLSKNQKLGVIGGLLLVVVLVIVTVANTSKVGTDEDSNEMNLNMNQENNLSDWGDLVIEDIEVGSGSEALRGSRVAVHYTGTLMDGTNFDSSHDRGIPFEFTLGAGQVIEGWEHGLLGMREGGKRRLTIPAEFAYGPNEVGIIPPNSTLIFEVDLVGVQ